jgi:hypothetical protein
MKEKQFNQLGRKYFGELLEPYGFTCEKSNYLVFYRQISNDIFHVVAPELSKDGTWFDIRAFATSHKIQPDFITRFPDDIAIPADMLAYLDPVYGFGTQKQYRCNHEEGFIRNFTKEAKPAILEKALPFLDGITNIETLIPTIRNDFYLGVAFWQVGEKEKALPILQKELERLSSIHDDSGRVASSIKFIRDLSGFSS